MAGILAGVLDDLGRLYEPLEKRFDDASWVTSRFVEILPIDLEEKQRCLEQCDPIERLRIVRDLLAASSVMLISSSPCAAETKPASKADGAR